MSIALQLLIGLLLGIAVLQSFGWWGVLVVASLLFAWELWHDLRQYRGRGAKS